MWCLELSSTSQISVFTCLLLSINPAYPPYCLVGASGSHRLQGMCGEEYGEGHSSYAEPFLKTKNLFKDSSPLLAGIAPHGCVVQRSPQVPRQRLSKEGIAHRCWETV